MSRYSYPSNEDQEPVTWLGGQAIYGAHLIVVVFVASLLATTLLMAFNAGGFLDWLVFRSDSVLKGQVWRVATYGLVNPPSLWFIVDMLMIVWFGRELEKFFGRRTFLLLYAGLYLITPLLFTLVGLGWSLALSGAPGGLALFTAFATLYPNVALSFGILAKWAATLLIGIYTLIHLSTHNWPDLLALAASASFAFAFVRHAQGRLSLPSWPSRKSLPAGTSGRLPEATVRPVKNITPDPKSVLMDEMDAILDQIAKSGMDSLSPKQRARLDAAREHLIKAPKSSRR
jgi:membrane associated rhomboid family serine protease